MRVVADSHAILWLSQGSPELSDAAADALLQAEETDGVGKCVNFVSSGPEGLKANVCSGRLAACSLRPHRGSHGGSSSRSTGREPDGTARTDRRSLTIEY